MNTPTHSKHAQKKSWTSPAVKPQGRVEDLTQWIGGLWGEFFGGQGSGWNPWKQAGGGS